MEELFVKREYTDSELKDFHNLIIKYQTDFNLIDGTKKQDMDVRKFLINHEWTDRAGRKFKVMKQVKGKDETHEWVEDVINIGTKCEGYLEDDYGHIKKMGNQPIFVILDKISQWEKWLGRQEFTGRVINKVELPEDIFGTF